jgi:hypothetical protein
MANAMVPVLDSDFARNAQGLLLREAPGGYQFVYQRKNDAFRVVAYNQRDNAVGLVRWVLGAGAQGQTPILQSGQRFYESRVSFFPRLHQYGITVGQDAVASSNVRSSLGRQEDRRQILECLNCHAKVSSPELTDVTPGVSCERCHAGAQQHSGDPKATVVNPGKLTAREQVRLCGTCHRNEPPVDEAQLENVRFQPLRLMKSRCFVKGDIRCTTCHAAHYDAKRAAPDFYNDKCRTCHAAAHAAPTRHIAEACITCHMPQIQLHPGLRFTDHFIRVAKVSEYPTEAIVQRDGEQRNLGQP